MARYRKRPVEIEAVQVGWTTWNEVCDLLGDALLEVNPSGAREINAEEATDTLGEAGPYYIAFDVRTVHGEIATVRHGDWLIPDAKPGTFYPCKPDVFAASYEPATAGRPRAAMIEIIERDRATDDTAPGSAIVPDDVRINGVSLLVSADDPVTVHEIDVQDRRIVCVTMTLLARRIVIAAEGDLLYDKGGMLPSGVSAVRNDSGKAEPVIRADDA